MPQVSVAVHELLKQYKKRCRTERKRPRCSSESPPALLPVSFAQAKDWLFKQQRAQAQAIESGAVNEEAREVAADLSRSLSEQASATARLLEKPARWASPVLFPPAMSLGPEPVSLQERTEEQAGERARKKEQQAAERARKKAEEPSAKKAKAPPKKKKRALSPASEARRERALARLEELGIQPLQASIYLQLGGWG